MGLFDPDLFDPNLFDVAVEEPIPVTPSVDSQSAHYKAGEEWYTCDRCGFNYPRSKMIRQLGLTVCRGVGTCNCFDEPGVDAYRKQLILPREGEIPPLPEDNSDV